MKNSRGLPEYIAPLLGLGFKKRAGEIFTMGLSHDVIGWLGLNRATRHRQRGEVEIYPIVGVRHQEVERLVSELRGDRFHSYVPCTLSTPVGYLLPQQAYAAWVFGPDAPAGTAGEHGSSDRRLRRAVHALPG
jgi:hypothetical protein